MSRSEKDFRPRPFFATVCAIFTLLLFGVVPYLIVMWIDDPSIIPYNVDFIDISPLRALFMRSVYFSPILAVLSFLANYYPLSSRYSLTFRILQIVVGIVFLLYVTNLGAIGDILTLHMNQTSMTIGVVFTTILGLMIALKLMKLIIIYADHKDLRDEDPNYNGGESPDRETGIRHGPYDKQPWDKQ